MDSGKAWWASRGVWGGVVAAFAGVAGLFGITLDAAAQAHVVDAILATCSALSALGGVLAIIGRLRAQKTISNQ